MNKFLVVLATVLVCVSARPDIGLNIREGGYQYGSPTGSYLPGAQQIGSNSYNTYNNGPQQHFAPAGVVSGQQYNYQGVAPQVGFVGQQNYVQQNFAQVPHKSYFFDAPEDLGHTHVRVHVQPSAAAGDKTIYIRAPAYNSKIVPHFNIAQQQAAGKTKVYVLVKKPEEQQDIVVPAAVQGPAAKPEVVFVKYSNQKEAEQKIQDIQQGASGGNSAKVVFNHRELVSSIKDEPVHHQQINYGVPVIGGPTSIHQAIIGGGGGVSHDAPTHFEIGVNGGSSGPVQHHQHHETANYGPAGASGPY
ncbi:PREDICTED: uncharacterized protein LOC108562073 [Nicrophorus vespilloides]|uniref:Uncharacterized protein LOC108562073 n=1 Tax=Nicrophorus vespilloides TaxID=110193 RepID=A0ABM1MMG7_NICVS|nr:PREDICTED: uncharacterized protein LOC108562073 [Nicrophorus vespilloides]